MRIDRDALGALIAAELDEPVAPGISALADCIRQGHGGIRAILFYGAGLWKSADADTVFDFYVITRAYRAFDRRWSHALLGRLLPPNVYYLEHNDSRCKFAVIRDDQFLAAAAGKRVGSQIWARFAQPARLVWARDDQARLWTVRALGEAAVTFHAQTMPFLAPGETRPRCIWVRGLNRTYNNEWRTERGHRAEDIYDASAASLDARTAIIQPACQPARRIATHGFQRLLSKAVYFLQLAKAVFTFDGGVDYALWKIERQSGVRLSASDFQRRHPLLAAWPLVWKAWRQGALR